MIKWLLLTIFLSQPVTAYKLLQWTVEPQEIRLATPVELVIELSLTPEEDAELLLPWPESDAFLISELKTELSDTEPRTLKLFVTVSFYRLGKVIFQGLNFANFELEGLELEVLSFISEQRVAFQFEEEPKLLPGTMSMLIMLAISIVLIPLLLLLFWYFMFPKIRFSWRRKWHLLHAYGKFRYTLLKLQRNCLKERAAYTYTLMNTALRSYLSSLFKKPCQSYTAKEIQKLLQPSFQDTELLFTMLKNSDRVRFSSIDYAADCCLSDLKNLKKFAILMHKGGQKVKDDKL